jgi:hypothetical protein
LQIRSVPGRGIAITEELAIAEELTEAIEEFFIEELDTANEEFPAMDTLEALFTFLASLAMLRKFRAASPPPSRETARAMLIKQ